jgi:two-component system nitrogen regulation response regulator NtrX
VDIFLGEAATHNREKRKTIDDDAMKILTEYNWPGNVRELKNLIERLAIMVAEDIITVKDLPANVSDPKRAGGELFSIEGMDEARIAFEIRICAKKTGPLSQRHRKNGKSHQRDACLYSFHLKRIQHEGHCRRR